MRAESSDDISQWPSWILASRSVWTHHNSSVTSFLSDITGMISHLVNHYLHVDYNHIVLWFSHYYSLSKKQNQKKIPNCSMYIQDYVFPMMTTWHHEAPMPKSSSRQREREVKEEEMNERLAADSLEIPALLSLNGSTQHFIPSLECRHTNTRSLICTSTRLFLLLETISRGWLLMAGCVRTAVKGEKHWPVLTRTVKTQLGVTGRSVVTQHDTGVMLQKDGSVMLPADTLV